MNYYEQFYDDLELMEYDDDPYHNRHVHQHDPYYGDDPYYERREPYYEVPGDAHYEERDPYFRDPLRRGRGQSAVSDERGHHFSRGHRGHGHIHHGERQGQGQFGTNARGFEGERFEAFDGRGRGQRGRVRGRGHADFQGDSGRGQFRGHRGNVRGQGERGRISNRRSRGNGINRGGAFGMTFVKGGKIVPEVLTNKQPTEEQSKSKVNEKAGNVSASTGGQGQSDTLRFDYKAYQDQPTEEKKEVTESCKVPLGYGYGYGPRSDLMEGAPEMSWLTQEEKEFVAELEASKASTGVEAQPDVKAPENREVQPPPQTQTAKKPHMKTAMINPSFNFVKANSEFRSTDVAFHETEQAKPKANTLSVNMGNKRVGLGFGVSAGSTGSSGSDVIETFKKGVKEGNNVLFDAKFAKLHQAVKMRNAPGNNGIQTLHMAIDKVKMSLIDDIRAGGRTRTGQPMFMCRLAINGVFIAEGIATTKKNAKHDAYKKGVELLMKEKLTVKENSHGELELKEKESEPLFKVPAGPHLVPPTPIMQVQQNTNQQTPCGFVNKGPTATKTNPGARNVPESKHSGPNAGFGNNSGGNANTFVKPKIVFHKGGVGLSDQPLEFKKPMLLGQEKRQTVRQAEAMADQLLSMVRQDERNQQMELELNAKYLASGNDKNNAPANELNATVEDERNILDSENTNKNGGSVNVSDKKEDENNQSNVNTAKSKVPLQKVTVNKGNGAKLTEVKPHTGPIPTFMPRQTFVKPSDGQKNVTTSESGNVAVSTSSSASDSIVAASSQDLDDTDIEMEDASLKVTVSESSEKSESSPHFALSSVSKSSESVKGKSAEYKQPFQKQAFVKSGESFSTMKTEEKTEIKPYLLKPPPKFNTGGRLHSSVVLVNKNDPRKRPHNEVPLTSEPKLKTKKVGNTFMNELEDLSQFIIIDASESSNCQNLTDLSILHNSANFNKVVLKVEYEPCTSGVNCSFIVSDHVVATAHGETKECAKNNAAKATLEELREMCYTIKVKQAVDSDTGGLTKEALMSDLQKSNEMIHESNVGSLLLRKMGWTGGGVGKFGQGRAEPVKAEMVIGRKGLGLQASQGGGKDFQRKVTQMLQDYIKNDEQQDLYFSSELTKEERATIHNIGQKMGLKTHSKGKGDNRYLIVSRKRSAHELLDHVIESGGSTSKYELVPPRNGEDFRTREDVGFGHGKQ